jgi:hypothetical protein
VPAAAVASTWQPRGGSLLTRSSAGAGKDAGARPGRLHKRAGSEAVTHFPKENDFLFFFKQTAPKIPILNLKNSFSKVTPKQNLF